MITTQERAWLDATAQRSRIYRRSSDKARRMSRAAHPETQGIEMLVCNWGNELAREAWRAHHRRMFTLRRACDTKVAATMSAIRESHKVSR